MEMPFEPIDRNGQLLKAGDRVRIIGVPDLSTLSPEAELDSRPVFEYLVGKYKRIREIDEHGLAEISFKIRSPDGWDRHTVWMEPYLLQLPKTKTSRSLKQADRLTLATTFEVMESCGFIGGSTGPEDLSENYKQYLDFGAKFKPKP